MPDISAKLSNAVLRGLAEEKYKSLTIRDSALKSLISSLLYRSREVAAEDTGYGVCGMSGEDLLEAASELLDSGEVVKQSVLGWGPTLQDEIDQLVKAAEDPVFVLALRALMLSYLSTTGA